MGGEYWGCIRMKLKLRFGNNKLFVSGCCYGYKIIRKVFGVCYFDGFYLGF